MTNIEKLMQMIPDSNTCSLVSSDINIRYFTGMKKCEGLLVCFSDAAYLMVDFRYIEKASANVKDCSVIEMKDRTVVLSELLRKHSTASVQIESDNMTVSELNKFRQSFPEVKIDSSNTLSKNISSLRIIKSRQEADNIKTAQKIAEETFDYILGILTEGMTEQEIAQQMDYRMKSQGAEDISFDTIVLTGKNTSMPHGEPGSTKLMKNQFLLMDYGAVVNGCHSDMTRTVYFGTPDEEEKRAYNTVLQAQLTALECLVPGIRCNELDSAARKYIDSHGYKGTFGHSLGHGVGYEIHEAPVVSQRCSDVLEEGMVITIEPGIYIPGTFGIRIEDMAYITNDSYENLTHVPKHLIQI
ncbi:MAG: aminopeptidase P family protein [Oscillospiraceae bacterium]|nr:aminopeptidase P family protein [Oscillospiraceae bacterium]